MAVICMGEVFAVNPSAVTSPLSVIWTVGLAKVRLTKVRIIPTDCGSELLYPSIAFPIIWPGLVAFIATPGIGEEVR